MADAMSIAFAKCPPSRLEELEAENARLEARLREVGERERELSEKAVYQWARMFESDEECQKVVLEFRQFRNDLERATSREDA